MKKFFLIITTMLCMVNMQAQTITMASYNIRYNNPDDAEEGNAWKQRCPHICEIINYLFFQKYYYFTEFYGKLLMLWFYATRI